MLDRVILGLISKISLTTPASDEKSSCLEKMCTEFRSFVKGVRKKSIEVREISTYILLVCTEEMSENPISTSRFRNNYFSSTRTINQEELQCLRKEMEMNTNRSGVLLKRPDLCWATSRKLEFSSHLILLISIQTRGVEK